MIAQRFSKNLRFARQETGLSPKEFAEKLRLSEASYLEIEEGIREPNFDELGLILLRTPFPAENLLFLDLEATTNELRNRDIKLLVLDVDGVLTDGGMYFTEKGDEMKRFNTKDGRGIMACWKNGIEVAFCSGGVKPDMIRNRAERLGVKRVYVGLEKKVGIIDLWREEMGISWEQIAYVGDDMNDFPVIQKVGLSGCPADATEKIKQVSDWVLSHKGGEGCVREFVERFLVENIT